MIDVRNSTRNKSAEADRTLVFTKDERHLTPLVQSKRQIQKSPGRAHALIRLQRCRTAFGAVVAVAVISAAPLAIADEQLDNMIKNMHPRSDGTFVAGDISGNWNATFTYGDTSNVGLVWIGALSPDGTGTHRFKFSGSQDGLPITGTYNDRSRKVTYVQTGTPNVFRGAVDRAGNVIRGGWHQVIPELANFGVQMTR
jgi:hypothetical protein